MVISCSDFGFVSDFGFRICHLNNPDGTGYSAVGEAMRIAQVAPLVESVPPRLYGGTERIVSYLTEELVELGHEVTLFASGDSQTRARLRAGSPRALRFDRTCRDPIAYHGGQVSLDCSDGPNDPRECWQLGAGMLSAVQPLGAG